MDKITGSLLSIWEDMAGQPKFPTNTRGTTQFSHVHSGEQVIMSVAHIGGCPCHNVAFFQQKDASQLTNEDL